MPPFREDDESGKASCEQVWTNYYTTLQLLVLSPLASLASAGVAVVGFADR
jgi:hypothetical protein